MEIATSIFNICYLRQLLFNTNAIAFNKYQVRILHETSEDESYNQSVARINKSNNQFSLCNGIVGDTRIYIQEESC